MILQGLKDLDYVIQEKSIIETCFNFEFESIVTESKFRIFEGVRQFFNRQSDDKGPQSKNSN